METNTAGLQFRDRLIGALIGIARAVDGAAGGNEYLITDSTDRIVREGLAATLPDANLEHNVLSALIQDAEDEKRRLIPLCYECAAPCGKNNNYYDMRSLYAMDNDVSSLKLLILCGIRSMAADVCRAAALGRTDHDVNRFFYYALFAVGEESFGIQELLSVAIKFGKMNLCCMALLESNNEED